MTAKKCAKKRDARAKLLFCSSRCAVDDGNNIYVKEKRIIRLQNSPYFCFFNYALGVNKRSEAENRERDSHALRACEARGLRARKTVTPRLFSVFEKNRLFCSLKNYKRNNNSARVSLKVMKSSKFHV